MGFIDENGVKYLWSKIQLEDYPNNETLIAVLKAIDETKADKTDVNKNASNIATLQETTVTHANTITALEEKVGDGFVEISDDKVDALFEQLIE